MCVAYTEQHDKCQFIYLLFVLNNHRVSNNTTQHWWHKAHPMCLKIEQFYCNGTLQNCVDRVLYVHVHHQTAIGYHWFSIFLFCTKPCAWIEATIKGFIKNIRFCCFYRVFAQCSMKFVTQLNEYGWLCQKSCIKIKVEKMRANNPELIILCAESSFSTWQLYWSVKSNVPESNWKFFFSSSFQCLFEM